METDIEIREAIHRLLALPRFPAAMIYNVLRNIIVEDLRKANKWTPSIRKLMDHFRTYYLGRLGAEVISIYGKDFVSTRPREASHRALNDRVGVKHPHFRKFYGELF